MGNKKRDPRNGGVRGNQGDSASERQGTPDVPDTPIERASKSPKKKRIEPLEPRILMSGTWVDPSVPEVIDGATEGQDEFTGTENSDSADGLGGDDTLLGEGGDDILSGGSGVDTVEGGEGDDTIHGGADGDTLRGDAGEDTIHGDGGDDTIHGGADVDTLYGGDDSDTLYGDEGADILYGDSGVDILHGGSEGDTLHGGADGDTLYGDAGDDTLHGGTEGDTLYGGEGGDTLYGEAGDDTLVGGAGDDTLSGGEGTDTADYSSATGAVRVDLTDTEAQDTGSAGFDTLEGIERVIGTDHDDVFAFSSPTAGATYTVEAGNGYNTIDLSAFDSEAVTVDTTAETITVDLGGSDSFTIEYDGVRRILTSDFPDGSKPSTQEPFISFTVEEGGSLQMTPIVFGGGADEPTYTWSITKGTGITIDDAAAYQPVLTFDERFVNEEATVRLTMTSPTGTSSQLIDLLIEADNDGVIITADDVTGIERETIQLDATLVEPEGTTYLYSWEQVDNGAPNVSLSGIYTTTPSFTAPELLETTDFQFQITATDGLTETSKIVTVTVNAANDPNTANAGMDQTVSEAVLGGSSNEQTLTPTVVTLNGTGSDPEGQSLTYSWTQVSGPAVTLSNTEVQNPTFEAPQGTENLTLVFEVEVSDGVNTDTDQVTITITAADDAPLIQALSIADNSTEEVIPLVLSVTAADPEGQPLTYLWEQTSGPAGTIDDPTSSSTTFTSQNHLVNTWVTLQVTVSDGEETSVRTERILINADNDAPSVDLGADREIQPGGLVGLFADANDPENKPLAYFWTQTDGPTVQFFDDGTAVPQFVSPSVSEPTDLTFQVEVSDGANSAFDTIVITVDPGSPNTTSVPSTSGGTNFGTYDGSATTPASGPGGPEPITVGPWEIDVPRRIDTTEDTPTTVTATVTGGEGDPTPPTFTWTQLEGESVTLSGANTSELSFQAPELVDSQVLIFNLQIDNDGVVENERIFVFVDADNDAPIPDAGTPQTVTEDDTVTLNGTYQEIEGQPVTAYWRQVSGPTVEWLTSTSDPNAQFRPDNTHTDHTVVMEYVTYDGTSTTTDQVTITVLADEDAPTVNAGPDGSVNENATFTFDPSSTDPEGEGLSFSWEQIGGEAVTILNANTANASFVASEGLTDGTATFRVTATDGEFSVTDEITVTINRDDDGPSLSVGADQTVQEEDPVVLTAVAVDPEGVPLTYSWTQITGPSVTIQNADQATANFDAPNFVTNTYLRFQVEVSDGTTTRTDSILVLVVADNDSPTVDAGPNQVVQEGDIVQMAGSAFEPEGQDMRYRWVQVENGAPRIQLSDANTLNPTFEASNVLLEETLEFQLTATDGTNTVLDTMTVTIAGDDDPAIAEGSTDTGTEDTTLTVNLNAEDVDFGGTVDQWRIVTLPANGVLKADNVAVSAGDAVPVSAVLTFDPTTDWAGTTTFDFKAIDNGLNESVTVQQTLVIEAVADDASITVSGDTTDEDTWMALPFSASQTDDDSSESITAIRITAATEGATFRDGTNTVEWTGTPIVITGWNLANLEVLPPEHSGDDFDVTFEVDTQESSNSDLQTTSETVTVDVTPVSDVIVAPANSVSTDEDVAVNLGLGGMFVDTDGSETHSLVLTDMPVNVTLTDGVQTWTSTGTSASVDIGTWDLENVTIQHELNRNFNFTLSWNATATDAEGAAPETANGTILVIVTAVADAPIVTLSNTTTVEDTTVALTLDVELFDTDTSEDLTIEISSIPPGARLFDGSDPVNEFIASGGSQSVDISLWDLSTLQLTPPPHSDADITLTVTATAEEWVNNDTASTVRNLSITVTPDPDAPTLSNQAVTTAEDGQVAIPLDPALTDTDGSESLTVFIDDVPSGTTITDGGGNTHTTTSDNETVDISGWAYGDLEFTPPAHVHGVITMDIRAVATEADGGADITTTRTLEVTVTGVPDAPTVQSSVSGTEDTAFNLSDIVSWPDTDGSETYTVILSQLPVGSRVQDGGGTNDVTTTDASALDISSWDLENVTITPPANVHYEGVTTFHVQAYSEENSLQSAVIDQDVALNITAVADLPDLTKTDGAGNEDTQIGFTIDTALTDTDGSETLLVEVLNIPEGAVLRDDGGNIFTATAIDTTADITTWNHNALTIQPPSYSGDDFDLTVRSTATEGSSSDTNTNEVTVSITVHAVANPPAPVSNDVSVNEDEWVTLDLNPGLVDTDGSESPLMELQLLPIGSMLEDDDGNSHTVGAGTTTLDITDWDLSTIRFKAPLHSDDDPTITFSVRSVEAENNNTSAPVTDTFTVTVTAVADTPNLSTDDASGTEDTAIPLTLSSSLVDNTNESLELVVSGIPDGAELTDGNTTFTAGGGNGNQVDIATWDLPNLEITPPEHDGSNITLTVTATSTEANGGDTATDSDTIVVTVADAADAPSLAVTATTSGAEDTQIPLTISTQELVDQDGSENLTLFVDGLPLGAMVTDGVETHTSTLGNTTADITGWNLGALTVQPPEHDDSEFQLTVRARATEAENNDFAETTATIDVTVTPITDPATITAPSATGNEDLPISIPFTVERQDTDGTESITSIVISAIPDGAVLTDGTGPNTFTAGGGNGFEVDVLGWDLSSLTITPPLNDDSDFTLQIAAETTEADGGGTNTANDTLDVTVVAVADAPTIGLTPGAGNEDTTISFQIDPQLTDQADGSESLQVWIRDIPVGATITDGAGGHTFTSTGGSTFVDVTDWTLTTLDITPPLHVGDDIDLTIRATSSETRDGDTNTVDETLTIDVTPVVDTPTIVTAGDVTGNEDEWIALDLATTLVDQDLSETLTQELRGLPENAQLRDGGSNTATVDGSGAVDISGWDLSTLEILAPLHSDDDITATIAIWATETENSDQSVEVTDTFTITVDAVADAPNLTAEDQTGNEDTAIAIPISHSLVDPDSETLSIEIQGIPVGATITDGVDSFTATLGNQSFDVTTWTLADITITPPLHSNVDFDLTVVSTATEANGGDTATSSETLSVTVEGVADAISVSDESGSGDEDTLIPFSLSPIQVDTDGSEAIGVTVSSIPVGATLRDDGANAFTATGGTTSVDISNWNLSALTIEPPEHDADDFQLAVTVTSTEDDSGDFSQDTATVSIAVTPVADAPTLSATAATGNEDAEIPLSITYQPLDVDGSQTHTLVVSSIPEGVRLSDGSNAYTAPSGGGSVDVSNWAVGDLTITAPTDSDADFTLTLTATGTETENSDSAQSFTTLDVTVNAVADSPTVSATDGSGTEDQPISFTAEGALTDLDGSEILRIEVADLPVGALISDGSFAFRANGSNTTANITGWDLNSLTITPPTDSADDFTLRIVATATELGSGSSITNEATSSIVVAADADAPTLVVSSASGNEDAEIPLSITATLADSDGSETVTVSIEDVPAGAILRDGSNQWTSAEGATTADLSGWDLTQLTFQPPAHSDDNVSLTIVATSTEASNGDTASTTSTLPITIAAVADEADLTVENVAGDEDTLIALPITVSSVDPDGSETVRIIIRGVPDGARIHDGDHTFFASDTLDHVDVSSWDFDNLVVEPAEHDATDFTLQVEVTTTEVDGGDSRTVTENIAVTVDAVADRPYVYSANWYLNEDSSVAIDIDTYIYDRDGSEELHIEIRDLPVGVRLIDDGGNEFTSSVGDQNVEISDWNHDSLTLFPAEHSDDNFTLEIFSWTVEDENGDTSSEYQRNHSVIISAVVDAPTLSVTDGSGDEDTAIGFTLDPALVDQDGSETLTVEVLNIPVGAVLSDGSNSFTSLDGVTYRDISGWAYDSLTVTPPNDSGDDFDLSIRVTARESANGQTSVVNDTVSITVDAVADAPSLDVGTGTASGDEDTAIALDVTSSLTDTDGSETLTVEIRDIPVGAILSDGIGGHSFTATEGNRTADVSDWDLPRLEITPTPHSDVEFDLEVAAISSEGENASTNEVTDTISVDVSAVIDAPTLTTGDVTGTEDTAIALDVVPGLIDQDGSESLTVILSEIPAGVTISDGQPGHRFTADGSTTQVDISGWTYNALTATPPEHSDIDFSMRVTVTSTEADGGAQLTDTEQFHVTVNADADAPNLVASATPTQEDQPIPLSLEATLVDQDGTEELTVVIELPIGITITDGGRTFTASEGDQTINVTADWNWNNLTLSTPEDQAEDFSITITATSREDANSDTHDSILNVPVTLIAVADAPTLVVEAASGNEDAQIPLSITTSSTDADGSETVTISIENVPEGAVLRDGDAREWTSTEGATTADLSGWDLETLTIQPPADDSSDFDLTVIATATEDENSDTETTTDTLSVTVTAVADAPNVNATTSFSTLEDTGHPLGITATLDDPSETLTLRLDDLPVGVEVYDLDGNSTTITEEMATEGLATLALDGFTIDSLHIRPAADDDTDFTVRLVGTSTESSNDDSADTPVDIAITVVAKADAATMQGETSAVLTEDESSSFPLRAVLRDTDGSESFSIYELRSVPAGVIVSDGTRTESGGGTIDLSTWDLESLSIQAPTNSADAFSVQLYTQTREDANGDVAVASETVSFTVTPVADAPSITTEAEAGDEDTTIQIDLTVALTDNDLSETLAIQIEGIPDGATLQAADGQTFTADDQTTSVDVSTWDLTQLRITPPSNSDADFQLTVRATSTETVGGDSAEETATIDVSVEGVADGLTLTTNDVSGDDGEPIPLDLTAVLDDVDGSEFVSLELSSTVEFTVTDGVRTASTTGGVVRIEGWDLSNLSLLPPAGYESSFTVNASAFTEESDSADQSSAELDSFSVTVHAAAVAPTVVVAPASGNEDSAIPLSFTADLVDTDGSETMSVEIRDIPVGAVVEDGTGRSFEATVGTTTLDVTDWDRSQITITPVSDSDSDFTLVVAAMSTESDGGDTAETTADLAVTVHAVADQPDLVASSDNEGPEDSAIDFDLTAGLLDTDGSESLVITASALPVGSILRSGTDSFTATAGATSVDITNWDHQQMSITPPSHVGDDFTIRIDGTATESENNDQASFGVDVLIEVTPIADQPTLSTVDGSGNEDSEIGFGITTALVDQDDSETLSIVLSDIPDGVTIRSGEQSFTSDANTDPAQTSVDITSWDLTALTAQAPQHSDDSFSITVTSTATEAEGDTSEHVDTIQIDVTAVPDAPTLSVESASVAEDETVSLDVTTDLVDQDSSETLSLRIEDLPEGTVLQAADGQSFTADEHSTTADITGWDLTQLRLTPPNDSDADFDLNVVSRATEGSNDQFAETSRTLSVTVTAVADDTTLSASSTGGDEDTQIPLSISTALTDLDGSETLVLEVGAPNGVQITDGVHTETFDGQNLIDISDWNRSNLHIVPLEHDDQDFTIDVYSHSVEERDGSSSEAQHETVLIEVTAVADPVNLSVQDASGSEDTPIALQVEASLIDDEGSESMELFIDDIPEGAVLSAGDGETFNATEGSTTADITGWDLSELQITPPQDSADDFTLVVRAVTTEAANSDQETTQQNLQVTVAAVADQPYVSAGLPIGGEDSAIEWHITAGSVDLDGSETFTLVVSSIPEGATLSDGDHVFTADSDSDSVDISAWDRSTLTITPPEDSGDDFTIRIDGTATETENGDSRSFGFDLPVEVTPIADQPTLSTTDGEGDEDTTIPFSITTALTDTDGSETLAVVLSGVPDGATVSDGVHEFTASESSGSTDITDWNLSQLRVTPALNDTRDFTLQVASVSTEAEGDTSTHLANISIGVRAIADEPNLSASVGTVREDQTFTIAVDAELVDASNTETLSIRIDDIPVGAKISDGHHVFAATAGNTSLDITDWNLEHLMARPPQDSDESFTLRIVATASDTESDTSASSIVDLPIDVTAIADRPLVSTSGGVSVEDEPIPFAIDARLADTDGSETLTVHLLGLPAGGILSDGSNTHVVQTQGAIVDISSWDRSTLSLEMPADAAAEVVVQILASSAEDDGGSTASTHEMITLRAEAVADAPTLSVASPGGEEDTAIPLSIDAALTDTDGSETLTIRVENLPAGTLLSDGTTSFRATDSQSGFDVTWLDLESLTITPPAQSGEDLEIRVVATSQDGEDGPSTSTSEVITIDVQPVADELEPSATDGFTATPNEPFQLPLTLRTPDQDGSEEITIRLEGMPTSAVLTAGTRQPDGSIQLTESEFEALEIELPPGETSTLIATVIVRDGDSVRESSTSFELGSLGFHAEMEPDVYPEPNTDSDGGGRPFRRDVDYEMSVEDQTDDDALEGLGALRDSRINPTEIDFEHTAIYETEAASYTDPTSEQPAPDAEESAAEDTEIPTEPEVGLDEGVTSGDDQSGVEDGSVRLEPATDAGSGTDAEEGNDSPFARLARALRGLFGNEGTDRRER